MSRSIHSISRIIPGSGPPDGRYLPYSGLSGRVLGLSPNSSLASYELISNKKYLSLKCSFRNLACNASYDYRRNPNSTKHKFSRNRNNRHNDKDSFEYLESSNTTLSSKNEPFFPVSSNQRSQGTATPGPREKEIVELFKKVQAQLRERAVSKEEGNKVETSPQGKNKESETVDSLLKLLRKHSAQQGKKTTSSANDRDFVLDHKERDIPSPEPADHAKDDEIQESPRRSLTRPQSSFQKRTPIPEIKFEPLYSEGENLEIESKMASLEKENLEEAVSESDSDESDVDALFPEGNELDEISGLYEEDEHGGVEGEEDNRVEDGDLSAKKLPELRALAKSRGLKGYSKLKKGELVELMNE